jgi:hypothetical protein
MVVPSQPEWRPLIVDELQPKGRGIGRPFRQPACLVSQQGTLSIWVSLISRVNGGMDMQFCRDTILLPEADPPTNVSLGDHNDLSVAARTSVGPYEHCLRHAARRSATNYVHMRTKAKASSVVLLLSKKYAHVCQRFRMTDSGMRSRKSRQQFVMRNGMTALMPARHDPRARKRGRRQPHEQQDQGHRRSDGASTDQSAATARLVGNRHFLHEDSTLRIWSSRVEARLSNPMRNSLFG